MKGLGFSVDKVLLFLKGISGSGIAPHSRELHGCIAVREGQLQAWPLVRNFNAHVGDNFSPGTN